jgi:hypothetical protein
MEVFETLPIVPLRDVVVKAVAGTALTNQNITFTDEAIQALIQRYTREAGFATSSGRSRRSVAGAQGGRRRQEFR